MERLKRLASQRFPKTVVVGGIATLSDMFTLAFLVKVLHFLPKNANIPSLIVGSSVQFIGNRNVVFKAKQGAIGRQIVEFIASEIGAMTLNAVGFYFVVTRTQISFLIARPLVTAIVFICFSYPLWKVVFRHPVQYK